MAYGAHYRWHMVDIVVDLKLGSLRVHGFKIKKAVIRY
jgi:hypothetical protein